MSHPPDPIAIIGAGATGLSCARSLLAAGRAVTVFDKSYAIGGRLATRRRGDLHWNHGAPAADVHSDAGLALMAELQRSGTVAHTNGRYCGAPDMRSLLQPLTAALELRCNHTIVRLVSDPAGWQLYQRSSIGDTAGEEAVPGRFAAVVCTLPPTQAAALLGASAIESTQLLAGVRTTPCWALLLTLSERRDGQALDYSGHEPLTSIHLGNTLARASRCWVAHCSAGWSQMALEWEPEQVVAEHLPFVADALGYNAAKSLSATAHRWRYALTSNALGAPCLPVPDTALVLAGDWCLGARVDDALASGQAAAAAVLAGPS